MSDFDIHDQTSTFENFENDRHNFILSDFDRHGPTHTFENGIHKYIMWEFDRHDQDPSFENDTYTKNKNTVMMIDIKLPCPDIDMHAIICNIWKW